MRPIPPSLLRGPTALYGRPSAHGLLDSRFSCLAAQWRELYLVRQIPIYDEKIWFSQMNHLADSTSRSHRNESRISAQAKARHAKGQDRSEAYYFTVPEYRWRTAASKLARVIEDTYTRRSTSCPLLQPPGRSARYPNPRGE